MAKVYKWSDLDKAKKDSGPPAWFQAWMDEDNYPIHSLCAKCKTRIYDWKNAVCKCKGGDPEDNIWICSICGIQIDNDVRSDYWHLNLDHPESMVMGRLSR